MSRQKFIKLSGDFFVDAEYKADFVEFGLNSIEGVFSFNRGQNLSKANLAKHRSRLRIQVENPPRTLFLKRYEQPPILTQIKNWLSHRRRACTMFYDLDAANKLTAEGINTPKTICYGRQWGLLFEKRSFIITEKIPDAESLERKLPACFDGATTTENRRRRRRFIRRLAEFVKKFHQTGYRHRDFYFAHVFYSGDDCFYLIDLQRCFKPMLFTERFRVKDIAQLYYSAPGRYFSAADRMRFYLCYAGKESLSKKDKSFIRKVVKKADRIARHDARRGRAGQFAN